jgi:N-methylhydantoinase B
VLSERRCGAPYGVAGGAAGQPGQNVLVRDRVEQPVDGKAWLTLRAGDRLRIETPGGGGYGRPGEERS